eukprot:TRINITY_DN1045_c0_g1_i1.p1 TRINITY_DN1045_c0_g1~~TRINITY_DN1045_c0_g1_i1.p1  ORF type:complete len:1258 (+),score=174.59 TRINITY_DN1045_c0_g1_i1:111-3776(+)
MADAPSVHRGISWATGRSRPSELAGAEQGTADWEVYQGGEGEAAASGPSCDVARIVSIRYCTLFLCVVCIISTVALCVSLALQSTERALESKDSHYQQAMFNVEHTSRGSIENLTVSFANFVKNGLTDQVSEHLNRVTRITESIVKELQTWVGRGIDHNDWTQFSTAIRGRAYGDQRAYLQKGLTACGVAHSVHGQSWGVREDPATLSNPPEGDHAINLVVNRGASDGFRVWTGHPDGYTADLAWDQPCCADCNYTERQVPPNNGPCAERVEDPRTLSYVSLSKLPNFPANRARWATLGSVGSLVGLGSLAPWARVGSAVREMAVICGADMRSLSVMLRQTVTVAAVPSMRLFTVQNSHWFTNMLGLQLSRALGIPDQDRLLTGVSHGESTYMYLDYEKGASCPLEAQTASGACRLPWVRRDTNASDPIIRAAAEAVNGSYLSFGDIQQVPLTVAGGPSEEYFLGTSLIQDAAMLNWSFVLCVSREPVLGAVDRLVAESRVRLRQEGDRVNEDVESDRDIRYASAAAIGLVLICIAVVFVYNINAPLFRLMREMQFVSEMDLDSVQEGITQSSLSEVRSMQQSFHKMTDNLREFRKYMPSNLLQSEEDTGDWDQAATSMKPPEGVVTLVFTDIKGSTSLWENATEGMGVGLKMHNAVMRKAIAECNGYEVKTVGDAFFVAFQSAEDACQFALMAQADLNKQQWPQELSDCGLPQSARVEVAGQVLFSGLRVRIGVHCGRCELEINPLTGRADYFGPPVNIAARLEANGVAGFVGASDEVVAAVGAQRLSEICGATVPLGAKELKGVSAPIQLMGLLPKGLEGRRQFVTPDGQEIVPQVGENPLPPSRSIAVAPSRKQVVPERLRAALTGTRGAVAHVIMPLRCREESGLAELLDIANGHLSAVELAAERTEGLLQLCAGSQLLVTWNAGRRCHNPLEQVVEFAGLVYRRMEQKGAQEAAEELWQRVTTGGSNPNTGRSGDRRSVIGGRRSVCPGLSPRRSIACCAIDGASGTARLGLAGGVLLSGNVSALHRRYATVLGGTIELAGALASMAVQWDTFVLCARVTSFRTRGHLRPLVRWQVPEWSSDITVSELNVQAISEQDPAEEFLGSVPTSPSQRDKGWAPKRYRDAWETGAQHVLLELADARPQDGVLRRVASSPQVSEPQHAWWVCGLSLPEVAVGCRRRGSQGTSTQMTSQAGDRFSMAGGWAGVQSPTCGGKGF